MHLKLSVNRFLSYLSVVLVISIIISSCSRKKGETIIQLTRQYYCERSKLVNTADSLWTNVSKNMDREIDWKMDSSVRKKILSMRSGPIIRSFTVYNMLSDSLKNEIGNAEAVDKILVNRMASISFKIDSVEMLKLEYLSEAGPKSSKAKLFLTNYNEAVSSPCKSSK